MRAAPISGQITTPPATCPKCPHTLPTAPPAHNHSLSVVTQMQRDWEERPEGPTCSSVAFLLSDRSPQRLPAPSHRLKGKAVGASRREVTWPGTRRPRLTVDGSQGPVDAAMGFGHTLSCTPTLRVHSLITALGRWQQPRPMTQPHPSPRRPCRHTVALDTPPRPSRASQAHRSSPPSLNGFTSFSTRSAA